MAKQKHVDKYSLKEEADKIMVRGTAPSMSEMIKLMKNSGKSFKQIVQSSKKLKKEMNAAKAQAESEGKVFVESAYLKERMNQPSK